MSIKAATPPASDQQAMKDMAQPQKPVKGGVKDFLKGNPAVVAAVEHKKASGIQVTDKDRALAEGGEPPDDQQQQEHQQQENQPPPQEPEKRDRKRPFVKGLKQEAEEYKTKYETAEAELKKARETEIPTLQQQINEWKEKAENAASAPEYKDAMEKATKLQGEMEELRKTVEQKDAALRFYNLQHDEKFVEGFVTPVHVAKASLDKVVAGNENAAQMLSRVISAHAAVLQSQKPEDKATHEQTRDDLLEELYGILPEMRRGRLASLFGDYLHKTEVLSHALINHEETGKKIMENRQREQRDAREKVKQTWRGAMEKGAEVVKPFETLPDDAVALAKELKLDYDITSDTQLASDVIDPDIEVPAEEATRLLQQGRVYKPLVARIKVLEKQLADRDELLSRYRGSKPQGESQSRGAQPPPSIQEGKSAFLKKFTPQS